MNVGSLFSGVGGIDLGLELAGMRVLWQVEYDKYCQSVLRHRFPGTEIYGDVREVGWANSEHTRESRPAVQQRAESPEPDTGRRDRDAGTGTARPGLARVDLICGGFPCQDLSVAGNRAGLAGERSGLWYEFHRIIGEIMPKWVLIENVPGLLSSNGGADLAIVLSGLAQLGYGWSYRILDSQYFGVAQRRRRVFIIGCLGDAGTAFRALHPVGTCLPGHPAPSRETREGTTGSTTGVPRICGTLSDGAHMGGGLNGQDAYTGRIIPQQSAPRRLTPRECERLQGFPDDWTLVEHKGKPMSDGPRYRMMGNAVTVNVAEWIGRRILEVENGTDEGVDGTDEGVASGRGRQARSGERETAGHTRRPCVPIDTRNATRTTEKSEMNRQGSGIGNEGDPCPTLTDVFIPAIVELDEPDRSQDIGR